MSKVQHDSAVYIADQVENSSIKHHEHGFHIPHIGHQNDHGKHTDRW